MNSLVGGKAIIEDEMPMMKRYASLREPVAGTGHHPDWILSNARCES